MNLKTITKTSLINKLNKLTTDKILTKNSLVYIWLKNLTNKNNIIRPVFSQGSTWKHSTLIDKSDELINILRRLKISYSSGNDAPRKGKTGYYIEINTKIINH